MSSVIKCTRSSRPGTIKMRRQSPEHCRSDVRLVYGTVAEEKGAARARSCRCACAACAACAGRGHSVLTACPDAPQRRRRARTTHASLEDAKREAAPSALRASHLRKAVARGAIFRHLLRHLSLPPLLLRAATPHRLVRRVRAGQQLLVHHACRACGAHRLHRLHRVAQHRSAPKRHPTRTLRLRQGGSVSILLCVTFSSPPSHQQAGNVGGACVVVNT